MLRPPLQKLLVPFVQRVGDSFRGFHLYANVRSSKDGNLNWVPSVRTAPAVVIDGRAITQSIQQELKDEIDSLKAEGKRSPHLSILLVGNDPSSQAYIRNKIRACRFTGISHETLQLPVTISEEELLAVIDRLNCSDRVDGIIVQLPVPTHISERTVCNAVLPSKDVDGFNVINVGRFCVDQKTFVPATPAAVAEILRRTGISPCGKNAVVVGRSKNVGLPIAMQLHAGCRFDTKAGNATTTICHRFTPPEELEMYAKRADILVSATGVPNLIRADMVKPGAAIIDVGFTHVEEGTAGQIRLVGDVDFEGVSEVAGYITPVPGGVGPVTVAMLMRNTLMAYKKEISDS